MGQTSNYGFPQWDSREGPGREALNQRFQESDQAIQAAMDALSSRIDEKSGVVTGFYTGNGAASRTISLDFTPKAVFVESPEGRRLTNAGITGGLALQQRALTYSDTNGVAIQYHGFTVTYVQYKSNMNTSGSTFYYLAVQ